MNKYKIGIGIITKSYFTFVGEEASLCILGAICRRAARPGITFYQHLSKGIKGIQIIIYNMISKYKWKLNQVKQKMLVSVTGSVLQILVLLASFNNKRNYII